MPGKEVIQKYKQLLPVVVLAAFSCSTAISYWLQDKDTPGISYDVLTYTHYIAFAAVSITVALFFVYHRGYRYALVATLLLGLVNGANFTLTEYSFTLGLGGLKITFQPLSLLVLALTYALNFNRANKALLNRLRPEPASVQTAAAAAQERTAQVEKYRETYLAFSDGQLRQLIEDKRYAPQAVEAARQLLEERAAQRNEG